MPHPRQESWRAGATAPLLPAAVVIAALYFARGVLIPVALAVLLTFLLAPVVTVLQRFLRSRALTVACVTVTAVTIVGAGALAVGRQFVGMTSRLPEYRDTIADKVRSIRESTRGVVADAATTLRAIGDELAHEPASDDAVPRAAMTPAPGDGPDHGPGRTSLSVDRAAGPAPDVDPIAAIVGVIRPLASPVATGLIVTLLLAMMLHSREDIRDRFIRLAGLRQISLTTRALEETGARVGRYLRAQVLINLIYGTTVYVGLLLVDVPNSLVCGAIAGVLRFVPILGIWLGAAIPAALAIAVFDGWGHLALVILLFVVLELAVSFVLEPWLYGISTGISSMGVVIAIVFWTSIWGGVGLVLAMPITVCVMVFARHLPGLGLVPILVGDEPVLSEPARFYQRLLMDDEDDAAAILRAPPPQASADGAPGSAIDRLDTVVTPALGTIRQELVKGTISDAQAESVSQGVRDVTLDWLGEQPPPGGASPVAATGSAPVICLPLSDETDACAGAILAAALEAGGTPAVSLSAELLLSEMLRESKETGASVVALCAVAPSSALHTRRVLKALQRALPGVTFLVCAWNGAGGNATPDQATGVEVVTTLRAAIEAAKRAAVSIRPR